MRRASKIVGVALAVVLGVEGAGPATTRESSTATTGQAVDPRDAERLQRVMAPLIRAMDNPRQLSAVKVEIMDDPRIDAANAGNGELYVSRG